MSHTSAVFELLKSLRGLAIPFAPFLITKGYGLFQKARHDQSKKSTKPISRANLLIISIILTVAAINAFVYIPYARPVINVFTATDSRMQTSGDLIGKRLRDMFGDEYENAPQSLTSGGLLDYELLVSRLASSDGRALYSLYGTEAYASCQWCRTDVPVSFFLYILPTIGLHHVLNFLPILLVTTGESQTFSLSTASSRQWFSIVTVVAVLALTVDAYIIYQAPNLPLFTQKIKNSPTLQQTEWLYWSSIKIRAWGFAVAESLLALLVYLSAAGRVFEADEVTSVRVSRITQNLDQSVLKLRLNVLLHTNVISRDRELRTTWSNWGADCERMETLVREAPEVKEARKMAKSRLVPGVRQIEANYNSIVEQVFQSQ